MTDKTDNIKGMPKNWIVKNIPDDQHEKLLAESLEKYADIWGSLANSWRILEINK